MKLYSWWINRALERAHAFEEGGWEWSGTKEGWAYNRETGEERRIGRLEWYFLRAFRWGIGHHFSSLRKNRHEEALKSKHLMRPLDSNL